MKRYCIKPNHEKIRATFLGHENIDSLFISIINA
mgnify:CR=1 FL=1